MQRGTNECRGTGQEHEMACKKEIAHRRKEGRRES
jgi:hypothetical protein